MVAMELSWLLAVVSCIINMVGYFYHLDGENESVWSGGGRGKLAVGDELQWGWRRVVEKKRRNASEGWK